MGDIPVKEIGALLDEVSGKVPKLITGLLDTIFSAEAGQKMGKSVGNLYKELVDSGIPLAKRHIMIRIILVRVSWIVMLLSPASRMRDGEQP